MFRSFPSLIALFAAAILVADENPDLSFKGLFDPKPDYAYFENATTCPLSLGSGEFKVGDAAFLAEFSMLSYVREHEIVISHLERIGFSKITLFDTEGTYAIAATNEKHTILVFRGTEAGDKTDFLTDVQFVTTKFGENGSAHGGFLKALSQIREQLSNYLAAHHETQNKQLWITGHSMGASLAILYGIEQIENDPRVYTFGAPRTVGKEVAENPLPKNLYRIVNDNDIVPKLAPKPFYVHLGSIYLITSDGELLVDPAAHEKWKSHLSGHGDYLKKVYQNYWKRGRFNAIPSDYIADHAPINYVVALKQVTAD